MEEESHTLRISNPRVPSNLEKCIILEGRTHGSYSYPDLLVDMERTHLGLGYKKVVDRDVDYSNQFSQRNHTRRALRDKEEFMLTLRQFVDFLKLLKSGTNVYNNVYNGAGKKLDIKVVNSVLDDILGVRAPYRGEFFDDGFNERRVEPLIGRYARYVVDIDYFKIDTEGNLYSIQEPLKKCLMKDEEQAIYIDSWMEHATNQGLPHKRAKCPPKKEGNFWLKNITNHALPEGGIIHYTPPHCGNGRKIALLTADSNCVELNCSVFHTHRSPHIGVRAVRLRK